VKKCRARIGEFGNSSERKAIGVEKRYFITVPNVCTGEWKIIVFDAILISVFRTGYANKECGGVRARLFYCFSKSAFF
jgi:hypothetical protein